MPERKSRVDRILETIDEGLGADVGRQTAGDVAYASVHPESCWRCNAAPSTLDVGLCVPCRDALTSDDTLVPTPPAHVHDPDAVTERGSAPAPDPSSFRRNYFGVSVTTNTSGFVRAMREAERSSEQLVLRMLCRAIEDELVRRYGCTAETGPGPVEFAREYGYHLRASVTVGIDLHRAAQDLARTLGREARRRGARRVWMPGRVETHRSVQGIHQVFDVDVVCDVHVTEADDRYGLPVANPRTNGCSETQGTRPLPFSFLRPKTVRPGWPPFADWRRSRGLPNSSGTFQRLRDAVREGRLVMPPVYPSIAQQEFAARAAGRSQAQALQIMAAHAQGQTVLRVGRDHDEVFHPDGTVEVRRRDGVRGYSPTLMELDGVPIPDHHTSGPDAADALRYAVLAYRGTRTREEALADLGLPSWPPPDGNPYLSQEQVEAMREAVTSSFTHERLLPYEVVDDIYRSSNNLPLDQLNRMIAELRE